MAKDLNYWKFKDSVFLLPLRVASFWDAENEEGTHFYQLEAESSWNLTAKTRNHSKGGKIQLGFDVSVTLYIMNNELKSFTDTNYLPGYSGVVLGLTDRLEKLKNRRIKTRLFLGGDSNPNYTYNQKYYASGTVGHDMPFFPDVILGSTNDMKRHEIIDVRNDTNFLEVNFDENLLFNYEIEQVAFRPRVIIKLSGFIKNPLNVTPLHKSQLSTTFDHLFI